METFDEEKAIEFIRATLPAEVSERYDDDDILYIIDIIWDWYERNGLLKIDAGLGDDDDIDIAKLTAYVVKEVRKYGEVEMEPSDIELIVRGELQYEESIEDIF